MFGNYSIQFKAFFLMVLANFLLAYGMLKEKDTQKKERKKCMRISFFASICIALIWIGVLTGKLAINICGILLLTLSASLFAKMETDAKNYSDFILTFGISFALCNGIILAVIVIWIIERFL